MQDTKQPLDQNEIENLILGLSSQMVLDNWSWKIFGFKSRPRRGAFFNRFIKKERLVKEIFLIREFFIIGCYTGVNSLPESMSMTKREEICMNVINKLLNVENILSSFDFSSKEEAKEYFLSGIKDYANSGQDNIGNVLFDRAKAQLGKYFSGGWLVYTARYVAEFNSPIYAVKKIVREKVNS